MKLKPKRRHGQHRYDIARGSKEHMKVSSNFLSWHYLLSSSQSIFVSLGCSAGGTLPLALLWLLVFLSLGRLISSGEAQCTLLQLAHISFALVMAYKHLPAHDSDVACVLDAPYTSAVAASPTIATSSGYPGRGRSRCLLVARRCSLAGARFIHQLGVSGRAHAGFCRCMLQQLPMQPVPAL